MSKLGQYRRIKELERDLEHEREMKHMYKTYVADLTGHLNGARSNYDDAMRGWTKASRKANGRERWLWVGLIIGAALGITVINVIRG